LNSGFTYSSTSSSITPAWTGMMIYRVDGTQTNIGSGSQAVTSLGGSRTFYLYPFYDESTSALDFVDNADVTFPNITGIDYVATSSQCATTTTSAALTTAFSIECWMKVASGYVGNGGILKATNQTGSITAANIEFELVWASGEIFGGYRDSGGTLHNINGTTNYADGNWHHVVYTCSPSTSSQVLYVDGVAVATGSVATAVSSTAAYYRLAEDASGIFYTGLLTEVAVYNAALTATQVTNHYFAMNSGSQSTYESVVTADAPTIWWKSTITSGTTIPDAGSIGGNTANLVNSPTLNQSSAVFSAVGSPAIAWPAQSLLVAQSQFLQGNIPLSNGGLPMATTASGSGGGAFGGSSAGTNTGCFSGNTLVKTPNGNVPIEQLKIGDLVVSKDGVGRKILAVLRHEADIRTMIDMGNGELATPNHIVAEGEEWTSIGELFKQNQKFKSECEVFNLSIDGGEEFDAHSFQLANGILAHNAKVY
jgi:Concanavalin A-like lectin/glucanases superfamily/Hint domain